MAYTPLRPYLNLGTVLTPDHIAHLDRGIEDARAYADEAAAKVQAGVVSDLAIDAAIDRAVADGRIPEGNGGGGGLVTVTEVQAGIYEVSENVTVTDLGGGIYEIGA